VANLRIVMHEIRHLMGLRHPVGLFPYPRVSFDTCVVPDSREDFGAYESVLQ